MKVIFLIEDSNENYEEMRRISKKQGPVCLNTEGWSEEEELNTLSMAINMFMDKDLMLIKCSGRESVMGELGDEYSEMMITLSSNRTSRHYIENTTEVFRDLVQKLFKETIEYGTITTA
jgi:hypothetical protein